MTNYPLAAYLVMGMLDPEKAKLLIPALSEEDIALLAQGKGSADIQIGEAIEGEIPQIVVVISTE